MARIYPNAHPEVHEEQLELFPKDDDTFYLKCVVIVLLILAGIAFVVTTLYTSEAFAEDLVVGQKMMLYSSHACYNRPAAQTWVDLIKSQGFDGAEKNPTMVAYASQGICGVWASRTGAEAMVTRMLSQTEVESGMVLTIVEVVTVENGKPITLYLITTDGVDAGTGI